MMGPSQRVKNTAAGTWYSDRYSGARQLRHPLTVTASLKNMEIAFLIASNFVIHPQILIISVFKIASLSPY